MRRLLLSLSEMCYISIPDGTLAIASHKLSL